MASLFKCLVVLVFWKRKCGWRVYVQLSRSNLVTTPIEVEFDVLEVINFSLERTILLQRLGSSSQLFFLEAWLMLFIFFVTTLGKRKKLLKVVLCFAKMFFQIVFSNSCRGMLGAYFLRLIVCSVCLIFYFFLKKKSYKIKSVSTNTCGKTF